MAEIYKDLFPINMTPNQPWNAGSTRYIVRVGSESKDQALARANSGAAVLTPSDLAAAGTIITNPNAVPGSGYLRVFIFGNSITEHPDLSPYFIVNDQNRGRGMAASTPANDFRHKLIGKLIGLNSGVVVRGFADFDVGSTLNISYGPYWENLSTGSGVDLSQMQAVRDWMPDLIIWRVGENVTDSGVASMGQSAYKARVAATIDYLTASSPGCKVVLTTSVWDRPNYDNAIRSLAMDRSYPLTDFAGMYASRNGNGYYALRNSDGSKKFPQYADGVVDGSNAGVDDHPNDFGMSYIADQIYNQIPQIGGFQYIDPANTNGDWDGYDSSFGGNQNNILIGNYDLLDNSVMTIKIMAGFGGGYQIYDKVTGQNLFNYFDEGRGEGHTSYSGPGNFVNSAPNSPWYGIGYNGVYDGDFNDHPSIILGHGRVTIAGYEWRWVYTQLLSWGDDYARRIPLYVKRWYRLDGNKVYIKTKLIHNRTDDTTQYGAYKQEWEFAMVNGPRRQVRFYNGTNPYNFDTPRGSDGVESGTAGAGNIREPGNGFAFAVSESWIATNIGGDRWVGNISGDYSASYNSPDYSTYAGENTQYGNSFMYAGFHPYIILDPFQSWYKSHTIVLGNLTEIRTECYNTIPRPNFSFRFNQANGRAGWFYYDGATDEREPFPSDNWKLTLTGHSDPITAPPDVRSTKIRSPFGAWPATDIQTVFVRVKYSGSYPNWVMEWNRVGEEPDNRYQDFPNERAQRTPLGNRNTNQLIPMTLISDGQFHTYQLNVGGNSFWNGIISEVDFRHDPNYGSAIPAGETLEFVYVSKDNLG